MLGQCCRLCLDVVHLLKSIRKVQNKGLILIICHCFFLHIYHICPGSGFVSLQTDPDPTLIIQIRIHKSGSASLEKRCSSGSSSSFSADPLSYFLKILQSAPLCEVLEGATKHWYLSVYKTSPGKVEWKIVDNFFCSLKWCCGLQSWNRSR